VRVRQAGRNQTLNHTASLRIDLMSQRSHEARIGVRSQRVAEVIGDGDWMKGVGEGALQDG
jgi:hypothetical protein